MSNRKALPSFEIHQTRDGSPTMSLEGGEKMHSLAGALSESLYIYGSCISDMLGDADTLNEPHILSMGLGLGYNEWISLSLLLKMGVRKFCLTSFEKVAFLRQGFVDYLQESENSLNPLIDDIVSRVAKSQGIDPKELREFARQAFESSQLQINEALPNTNSHGLTYNAILYDAFSSGTNSDLWSPSHLHGFLQGFASPTRCHFATYAATGNLKRALKANSFTLKKKLGFAGKRDSIYAVRLLV